MYIEKANEVNRVNLEKWKSQKEYLEALNIEWGNLLNAISDLKEE